MPATTYVLVHGSHTNAAAWGPVARELTLRGHRALAVDLPGHGLDARPPLGDLAAEPSDMTGRSTADEIAVVVDAVRRAHEHGPVVLVGHSRGGLAVTGAANAVPDLLDHVVYVSAWCCVAATPAEYAAAPENADNLLGPVAAAVLVADPGAIGAIRLDWRTSDPEALATLQRTLLADGTREELVATPTPRTSTSPWRSTTTSSASTRRAGAGCRTPTSVSPTTARCRWPCRTGGSPRPTPPSPGTPSTS
jgi:pimeloyl-ACP methyl ester carboxylesterase